MIVVNVLKPKLSYYELIVSWALEGNYEPCEYVLEAIGLAIYDKHSDY